MKSMNDHAVVSFIKDVQDFINEEEESHLKSLVFSKDKFAYTKYMRDLLIRRYGDDLGSENSEELTQTNFELISYENIKSFIAKGKDNKNKILERALNILYTKSVKDSLDYIKDNPEAVCKKKIIEDFEMNSDRLQNQNLAKNAIRNNVACYTSFWQEFLNHYINTFYELNGLEAKEIISSDSFFATYIKDRYKIKDDETLLKFAPLVYWAKTIFFSNIRQVKAVDDKKIVIHTVKNIKKSPSHNTAYDDNPPRPSLFFLPERVAFQKLNKLSFHSMARILESFKVLAPIVLREDIKDLSYYNKKNNFDTDKHTGKYSWLFSEFSDYFSQQVSERNHRLIISCPSTKHYQLQLRGSSDWFQVINQIIPSSGNTANGRDNCFFTFNDSDYDWNDYFRNAPKLEADLKELSKYNQNVNFEDSETKGFDWSKNSSYNRNTQNKEYNKYYKLFTLSQRFLNLYNNSYSYFYTMSLYLQSAYKVESTTVPKSDTFFKIGSSYFIEPSTKIFTITKPKEELREGFVSTSYASALSQRQQRPSVPTTTLMSFFDYAEAYAEALNVIAGGGKTRLDYGHRNENNKISQAIDSEGKEIPYETPIVYSDVETEIIKKMYRPVSDKVERIFYSPRLITSSISKGGKDYTGFFHQACKTGVLFETTPGTYNTEFYYKSRYKEPKSNYKNEIALKRDKAYFETYDIPHPDKKLTNFEAGSYPSFNLIQLKRPTAYLIKDNCADCTCLKTGQLTGEKLRSLVNSAKRMDFSYGYKLYDQSGKDKQELNSDGTLLNDKKKKINNPYREISFDISSEKGNYCLFSPIVPQSHDVGEGSSEVIDHKSHTHNDNGYLSGVFTCPMIDALYLTDKVEGSYQFPDVQTDIEEAKSIQIFCSTKSVFPLAEDEYKDWCYSSKNDVCDQLTDAEIGGASVRNSNQCRRSDNMSMDDKIKFERKKFNGK
jgi:hypothetical protein